jgi:membrane-associated phospholipid phosphatase
VESRFGHVALVAGFAFVTAITPLQAQQPEQAQSAPSEADTTALVVQQGTPQESQARPFLPKRGLFTQRDAIVAGAFVAGAAAMLPLDRHIASELQNPSLQANQRLSNVAHGLEGLASPGAYYIGGAIFLAGRTGAMLSDSHAFDEIADLGWHGLKAVALAEATGFLLKGTIGRARPYVSNATQPHTFRFGGGFGTSDYRALPSGHTYTAFAVASVVTSETRRWNPKSTWFVAPAMYGGATLVGLSRMYHNRHWASDIVRERHRAGRGDRHVHGPQGRAARP